MVARIGPYRVLNLLCETRLSRRYRVFDQRHNRVAILKLAPAEVLKAQGKSETAGAYRRMAEDLNAHSSAGQPHKIIA
ncbi:MAG: hypothetical protein SWC96_13650 [Thermodesulfobacteriota bacterium]|nr:hypothetical protein [Thermodesulfobacteriota bacterium]